MRSDGREKKSFGENFLSKGPTGGKTKEKYYQEKGKSQGRNDYSNKEFYYYKKKGEY